MSEETADKPAPQKPSARIGARLKELELVVTEVQRQTLNADFDLKLGRAATASEIGEYLASKEGVQAEAVIRIGLWLMAIAEELDREAERRSAWEKRVEAFARDYGVEI
jgi:hypothetical protein